MIGWSLYLSQAQLNLLVCWCLLAKFLHGMYNCIADVNASFPMENGRIPSDE